jgi:hypothetical protein
VIRVGPVALLVVDDLLQKMLKLELHIASAAVSELETFQNKPLATSGGDSKNRPVTSWVLFVAYLSFCTLNNNTHINCNNKLVLFITGGL